MTSDADLFLKLGILLRSLHLFVDNDRKPDIAEVIVEACGKIMRKIDTSVRPAVYVNLTSEASPPDGIVKTDTAVERHPEVHMTVVFAAVFVPSVKDTVCLHGINPVFSERSAALRCHFPGYAGR